jgi:hypothetical protein
MGEHTLSVHHVYQTATLTTDGSYTEVTGLLALHSRFAAAPGRGLGAAGSSSFVFCAAAAAIAEAGGAPTILLVPPATHSRSAASSWEAEDSDRPIEAAEEDESYELP